LPSTLKNLRIDYPAICCLPNSVTGLTVLDQAYHDITNTVPLCPTSPSITTQPAPATQSVCFNSSPIPITISASQPNFGFTDGSTEKVSFRSGYSYQWYSNANNSNSGGTIITGATSTSYTPPTTMAGTIYYYCIVTNGCNSFTTSSTAIVVVNALRIVSISGLNTVAKYSTINLTGSPTGGTWSSSAAAATIDSATGVVTGVNCGLAFITYNVKAEGANRCVTKNPQTIGIFVTDTTKPVFTYCPSDISVNNDAGNCSALVTYKTPTATDNCGAPSVIQTVGLASVTTFPLGLTTNTYTATDGSNNTSTCSFKVMVIDNEKPNITCPSDISVNNDVGNCSALVTYTTPTATDNCGAPSVAKTSGLASGSTFSVGLTTNTYTATDGSKNTSTCSFNVTVIDNDIPIITCPSNVTVNSDLGICGAKVNYSVISTDNCSATANQTAGFASGSAFPIGTTINTYFASDPSNNVSAPCSFNVTVIDNDVPVITSPAATYTACVSDVLNLTASATTNNKTMSVKWQRQNQGGTSFTDVTSYMPYISGSIAIYTTPTLFAIDNGAQYRAVFSTNCSSGFNSTATTFQINVCTPPIGQRGFPQGLPDCQKSAFRNLEKIYDTSNGANWKRGADKTKAEAWFISNLSNWYGVTMTPDGCDVLAIDLSNNLTQFDQNNYEYIVGLPQNFNYFLDNLAFPKLEKFDMSSNNIRFNIFDYSFPSLKVLNLSNNKLVGNIPELKDCINLQKILVDSNQLSGNIPDFKQLRLDTIDVSTNNFIFGDIANKSWLSKDSTHKLSIAYAPQALIPLRDTNGVLSVFTGEPDSIQKFKWYRIGSNNDTSLVATTRSHRFAPALSGNYYCFITHDTLTRPDDVNRNLILKTSNDSIQLSTTVQLSGSIKSENNQAITDVTVSAVETLHATSLKTSTDDRGDFTATLLRSANYQARPIKTSSEDKFSGVSTYDIALISKHILGIEALNSPYKIIAADVDKSNEVDAADILALRRFILNIDTSLQAGIWRFIDKSYEFINPTNPLSEYFPEVANVNLLTGAPTANFVAIKVGDVNQSYSSEFGKTVVRAAKTIELSVESCELSGDSKVSTTQPTTNNYQLISANEYTIKINAENFTAQTLQGTFQFKDAKVKAVKVGNLANLSDANFGVFTDAVTTSWNGKGSYLNPSVLQIAEITFVANTNAKLTDILSFGSTKTPAVANDANGNEADVVLKFNSSQGVINNYQPSTLSIVPNPAKERVTVNFISTDNATLSIYDLVGRLLKTQTISSGATDINIADLQTGCYLVVVRSNETRLEQKLIKQ